MHIYIYIWYLLDVLVDVFFTTFNITKVSIFVRGGGGFLIPYTYKLRGGDDDDDEDDDEDEDEDDHDHDYDDDDDDDVDGDDDDHDHDHDHDEDGDGDVSECGTTSGLGGACLRACFMAISQLSSLLNSETHH